MTRRKGFSILELMVASALLSVIGLAVIGAISQSAKEVKTTSEYSISLFLSQKVVEELLESVHENVYADEAVSEINAVRSRVGDGVNPFYAALEDDREPFGKIEPGVDLRIEPKATDLYRLYRDFNFTLADQPHPVTELPGSPENAIEVELHYDWSGLKGAQRDFYFSCLLAKAVVKPPPVHPLMRDIPGMDEAIREWLYPDRSEPLPTVVADLNGKLEIVRDIGAIAVLGAEVEETLKVIGEAINEKLDQTPDRNPALPENPELRIELGSLFERQAALEWQALMLMKDPANRSKTFKGKDLGGKDKVNRLAIIEAVSEAAGYWDELKRSTAQALRHDAIGRSGLEPLTYRAYRTYGIERKIIELIQLQNLLEASPDLSYLHQWIDYLREVYGGRNRMASDYLTRERMKCSNLNGVRALHPEIVNRIDDGDAASDHIEKLRERAIKELFKKDEIPLGF